MGVLPQVSGGTLVKALCRLGYQVVSQNGSHIKLRLVVPAGTHVIIVPDHRTIAKGTLSDILGKVSLWTQKSRNELIELLR